MNASIYDNSQSGQSTLSAINNIKHRDKIIVADWHYSQQYTLDASYPSVDYFQKMDFKDVWGATQYKEKAIRQFSHYAARRHIGGMIATTFDLYPHQTLPGFARSVVNSALYFINPSFTPPKQFLLSYHIGGNSIKTIKGLRNDDGQVVVLGKGKYQLKVSAKLPKSIDAKNARAWLYDEASLKLWVSNSAHIENHVLHATIDINTSKLKHDHLLGLDISYQDNRTGYIALSDETGAVAIHTNHKVLYAGKADNKTLFTADFSKLSSSDGTQVIIAPGSFGGVVLARTRKSSTRTIKDGALNIQDIWGAYLYPKKRMWEQIAKRGMRMIVVAKVAKKPMKKTWYNVLSYGGHDRGFRLLMNKSGKLLLQCGSTEDGGTRTQWIRPSGHLQVGKWEKIIIVLSPPDRDKIRHVSIRLVGHKAKSTILHMLRNPETGYRQMPFGLGVGFHATTLPPVQRQLHSRFPGLIRKVAITQ